VLCPLRPVVCLVLLLCTSSAEAGFVWADSTDSEFQTQRETGIPTTSGAVQNSGQKPPCRFQLNIKWEDARLLEGSTTSTCSSVSSSSSDTLPGALPLPTDEQPPLCLRHSFLQQRAVESDVPVGALPPFSGSVILRVFQ